MGRPHGRAVQCIAPMRTRCSVSPLTGEGQGFEFGLIHATNCHRFGVTFISFTSSNPIYLRRDATTYFAIAEKGDDEQKCKKKTKYISSWHFIA